MVLATPPERLNASHVRFRYWQFAPNTMELETLTVGELATYLEQAMGEAGVPREADT